MPSYLVNYLEVNVPRMKVEGLFLQVDKSPRKRGAVRNRQMYFL